MANYIDKEILCESYTNLNIDLFEDKEALDKLKIDIAKYFEERAKFLFGNDITYEIEFEDGSLIIKVKLLGSVALFVGAAISSYGSFKDGINQLTDDSILLAQGTNLEVVFKTKANYCDRVTFEKRTGVLGRTQELLQSLDSARTKVSDNKIPTNQTSLEFFEKGTSALLLWEGAADKLLKKVKDNNETMACLSSGFLEELEKFPKEAIWVNQFKANKLQNAVINADINFSSNLAAAATKYSSVLSSLKSKMKKIVDESTLKST